MMVPFDRARILQLKHQRDEALAQFQNNKEEIKNTVEELKIEEVVGDHPYISLGVAAVGGFLATRMISGAMVKKSAFMAMTAGVNATIPALMAKFMAQQDEDEDSDF